MEFGKSRAEAFGFRHSSLALVNEYSLTRQLLAMTLAWKESETGGYVGYSNYPDDRQPYTQRHDYYQRQDADRDDAEDNDDNRNSPYGGKGKNRRRGGFLDDFLDFG